MVVEIDATAVDATVAADVDGADDTAEADEPPAQGTTWM